MKTNDLNNSNGADGRHRYMELEGLRGLAALLVVLYHIPIWNPLLDIPLIRNGYLMVDLFFVLSGFVIGNAYSNNIRTSADLLRFQWLRFGRLYPLHLLFLALFIGIEVLRLIAAGKTGAGVVHTPAFSVNSPRAFIEQLLLIQAIGPTGNAYTFNIPAWSISVEFYVYAIFGLIAMLAGARRNLVFGLISFLSVLALALDIAPGWFEFMRGTAGFFLGTLIAHARIPRNSRPYGAFGIVVALSFVGFLFASVKDETGLDFLVYAFATLLIASLIGGQGQSPVANVLKWPALAYLGKISFALYMCHSFLIWTVTAFLKYVLVRPEQKDFSGGWVLQLSVTDTLISVAALLAMTLTAAALLHRHVEQPLREKSRKLLRQVGYSVKAEQR